MSSRIFIILFIFTTGICSGQTVFTFDTLGTRGNITLCDTFYSHIFIDSAVRSHIPVQSEIESAEILLQSRFLSAKAEEIFPKGVILHDYSQQCLAGITQNGHVLIWINCTCEKISHEQLKTPYMVEDGGYCFFNILIDLTANKIIDFYVNGDA